ncbi:endonuclease/exonuclease/phosphatase family protein [Streptomyces bambusae]|uniref:endonuclease/exonuclease/phosphatase family protein n=1 Tax=Streptomyces bambusae TaxID=1550616 RepID=UPI001CFF4036|nr:endonuclease/exonuclease/phosphatase family protein [Streptomyces bambusae]MCB5166990.1 endonuclease/exonuclease/phosphatase family protein [Streptomyces bambusae]
MTSVRVMTWNLWWRFGDWQERRKAILGILEETDPDVCGLQEVWQDRDENLAGWLAAELGLHWAWGPARNQHHWQARIGDPDVQQGTAILSRWPLTGVRTTILSEVHGRTALGAVVQTPTGGLPFLTGHLSSRGPDTFRRDQALRLSRMAVGMPDAVHPPVVTGDFNAAPGSPVLEPLTDTFCDAWAEANPGDPGGTWLGGTADTALRPDAGAAGPARIDHILVCRERGTAKRVVSARLAALRPVAGIRASDHAAVVADLVDRRLPAGHRAVVSGPGPSRT